MYIPLDGLDWVGYDDDANYELHDGISPFPPLEVWVVELYDIDSDDKVLGVFETYEGANRAICQWQKANSIKYLEYKIHECVLNQVRDINIKLKN